MKKILITGSAGFIGYHLTKKLNNSFEIYGLDNLNNYYDVNLKKKRNLLVKNQINFFKIDLLNKKKLKNFFDDYNFDVVVHLAAQAGVRYSFDNPDEYINSNILGTYNLLECVKDKKIKHLLIASTSSVYGFKKDKIPFNETFLTNEPLSLYAATKKMIEILGYNYSVNFKIPITFFRFFTVYGPWGRPDMALFKFVKAIFEGKKIDVYNKGQMWRDFTYIDDLVESISRLIKIAPNEKNRVHDDTLTFNAPYRIVNIGNQNSIKLNDFISTLEKVMGKKAIKNYLPIQAGDVPFTLSDSRLLKSLTGYSPSTEIYRGIEKFYEWYCGHYKHKKNFI